MVRIAGEPAVEGAGQGEGGGRRDEVLPLAAAVERALARGLTLVEVSRTKDPDFAVTRIVDLKKHMYELKKEIEDEEKQAR